LTGQDRAAVRRWAADVRRTLNGAVTWYTTTARYTESGQIGPKPAANEVAT